MIQFIQQNMVLLIIILCIIGAFAFYYFVSFKSQIDEASKKSGYDLWHKLFGKSSRIILFLLLFIGLPALAYFILVPLCSVDTTTVETISDVHKVVDQNTNLLVPLYERFNQCFGKVIDHSQHSLSISGLVILGIGVIMLIGLLIDADWMLDSSSKGPFNFILRILTDLGHRKKARLLMLIPTVLFILLGVILIVV